MLSIGPVEAEQAGGKYFSAGKVYVLTCFSSISVIPGGCLCNQNIYEIMPCMMETLRPHTLSFSRNEATNWKKLQGYADMNRSNRFRSISVEILINSEKAHDNVLDSRWACHGKA